MGFDDTIDDHIHEGAVSDQLGRKFVEICGQDVNVFGNHGSGGRIVFFCGVPGRDDVAVPQMEAGSADEDLAGTVRGALILGIFKDTDRGLLGP